MKTRIDEKRFGPGALVIGASSGMSRSAIMSVQPLFSQVRVGDLDLPNRIVMAPLTRIRAGSIDHVPSALQAGYYSQRASAGLIVAEATAISPDGFGHAETPGLWNAEQVRGI